MADSTYIRMYNNKIAVHPDAIYGSGFYRRSNWALIEYQGHDARWLNTKLPIDEHYVSFGFSEDDWRGSPITIAKLTGATIIDVPESFETVEDYLSWLDNSGIHTSERMRSEILGCKPNIVHKVMRNYAGAHVFPGGFYIVGMDKWKATMLDGGTHQHAVRCLNAKRCYQTFCGSSFKPEHHELYQVLSTFPDLTTKEMHDAGIEDFD